MQSAKLASGGEVWGNHVGEKRTYTPSKYKMALFSRFWSMLATNGMLANQAFQF